MHYSVLYHHFPRNLYSNPVVFKKRENLILFFHGSGPRETAAGADFARDRNETACMSRTSPSVMEAPSASFSRTRVIMGKAVLLKVHEDTASEILDKSNSVPVRELCQLRAGNLLCKADDPVIACMNLHQDTCIFTDRFFIIRRMRLIRRTDLMDPPSYGRGPKGEIWKVEDNIHPLLKLCVKLLSDDPLFFLINSYTTGFAPGVLSYLLGLELSRFGGKTMSDGIGLPVTSTGLILPCGASGRWEA